MEEPGAIGPPPSAPGPAVEKSTVLRLLATGLSPEAIAERVSERFAQRLTIDDVRSVLRQAAALLEGEPPLLPPAEAAFVDHFRAVVAFAAVTQGKPRARPPDVSAVFPSRLGSSVPEPDLDGLRRLSQGLIRAYLGDGGEFTHLLEVGQSEQHRVAMQYAEAVLRQGEVLERLNSLGEDAPLQIALPGPDRKRTDEFLLYRNLRGHFETLDSLVVAWQNLVEALNDHPESLLFEEYDDWLTKRDSLEDALSLLSPAARKDLETMVRQLDERFLEATQPIPTSIKPTSPWVPRRWWWYRRPHRLDKHFQHRLEHLASARNSRKSHQPGVT